LNSGGPADQIPIGLNSVQLAAKKLKKSKVKSENFKCSFIQQMCFFSYVYLDRVW